MSYFDKPASQAVLAIFPMYDEETKLALGNVMALDGTPQHQQLVDSGYIWRRFGNVPRETDEYDTCPVKLDYARYVNYVPAGLFERMQAQESDEAARAYQDAR